MCKINNNLESTAGNFNGYRNNRTDQGNREEEQASR